MYKELERGLKSLHKQNLLLLNVNVTTLEYCASKSMSAAGAAILSLSQYTVIRLFCFV